ncbi:hypothetical protein, partial [Pseudomonas syringae]|uniref:hypothetical protein n=1 Tax=Pseudomonas syringae TaxID=317 RepID=UPI0019D6D325
APALDASLRKSDAIRAELAKATTLDTQPRRRVKGYVSRGQGHYPESSFVLFAGKMDDIIQSAEPGDPRRELAISGYHPMFTAEINL